MADLTWFECLSCKARMTSLSALELHIAQMHLVYYPYTCKMCNIKLSTAAVANAHANARHGDVQKDQLFHFAPGDQQWDLLQLVGNCEIKESPHDQVDPPVETSAKRKSVKRNNKEQPNVPGGKKTKAAEREPELKTPAKRMKTKKAEQPDKEQTYVVMRPVRVTTRKSLPQLSEAVLSPLNKPKITPRRPSDTQTERACAQCGAVVLNTQYHVFTHMDVYVFHCSQCSYKSRERGNLNKHIKANKCKGAHVIDTREGDPSFGDKFWEMKNKCFPKQIKTPKSGFKPRRSSRFSHTGGHETEESPESSNEKLVK